MTVVCSRLTQEWLQTSDLKSITGSATSHTKPKDDPIQYNLQVQDHRLGPKL